MDNIDPFTIDPITLKKLAFACRRGNAESEALLTAFLPHLTLKQLPLFQQLLQTDDATLFQWLMQPENASPSLQSLIQKIKKLYR